MDARFFQSLLTFSLVSGVVPNDASGAFGSVYKGKHTIFTNRPIVAIKLLHTHLSSQEERDRFFQEARLLLMQVYMKASLTSLLAMLLEVP